jgi:periplasmic protein TonB
MLAYAANRPQFAVRRPSPKALLLIVGAHVAVLTLVMTAKMDLPQRILPTSTTVQLIPDTIPPPPNAVKPTQPRQSQQPQLTQPPRQVETTIPLPNVDSKPTLPDIGDLLGPSIPQPPRVEPQPVPPAAPPTIARLLTPQSELKPPYPQSKLLTGEEGVLNLRLSIDEQGRVTAVDPVGAVDKTFFDAARRYLIAHWRYRPATRDGHPVASSLTITLRFELD